MLGCMCRSLGMFRPVASRRHVWLPWQKKKSRGVFEEFRQIYETQEILILRNQ